MNNLKQTIYSTIQRVAKQQTLAIETIRDQDALVDNLGLKSLDLARIIATLELTLDVEPFAELVSITSIRTVGDLCDAYAKALAAQEGNATEKSPSAVVPTADLSGASARERQQALRKQARLAARQ